MAKAKTGDTVKVHYTGTLEDGSVFDSSEGRDPLEFKMGEGSIIPGFEKAVEGMEKGDSETVTIEADDAYGPYQEEMVFQVSASEVPEDLDPKVGEQLQVRQADGSTVVVVVKAMDEKEVTLDANHPLAGKALTFKIELVEIA
jgi:peptidylprolyl isomerase